LDQRHGPTVILNALMNMQENTILAPLTTLKVGGPARYFVEAKSSADVLHAIQFAHTRSLPIFVLGGGSNVVIADAGWPGLVLKIALSGIDQRQDGDSTVFDVGAGEDWDNFVGLAVARNCAGIECLSGIPGSVGGTPVQNVGAYGQEVSQTIESVQVLDTRDMQVRELCNEACGFSYRTSIFNTTERGRFVILRVTYRLATNGEASLQYADLKNYFAGKSASPSLSETREAVRQIRARKGMLIEPGDQDSRSAGSFFKNPVLSAEQMEDVRRRAAARNLQVPSYPALQAQHKISAAWLVEHSGFTKGYGTGPVGISRKHALAIVNRGGATAADIFTFQQQICDRVEAIWGIRLDPEPVFVG
jgi:UDP-N-acetylmuramate dehydrogenase